MSDDNRDAGRRKVLQITGASLTGLIGATSLSAARPSHAGQQGRPDHAGERGPPEHANAPGWLAKKGNRVELAVTENEYKSHSASEVDGIPDNARRVPFEVLQLQVEAINEEIKSNNIRVENSPDGFSIEKLERTDLSEFGVDQ